MKKIILTLVASATLLSCGGIQKISGKYPTLPISATSNDAYDQTWDKIIDLFTQSGISIKILDKQSGLIVAEKTNFKNSFSYENKNGNLENPNAYVVVEKFKNAFGETLKPTEITGDWNIRIKKNSEDKVIITVSLNNLKAATYYEVNNRLQRVSLIAKSTGVFEKSIIDLVK